MESKHNNSTIIKMLYMQWSLLIKDLYGEQISSSRFYKILGSPHRLTPKNTIIAARINSSMLEEIANKIRKKYDCPYPSHARIFMSQADWAGTNITNTRRCK